MRDLKNVNDAATKHPPCFAACVAKDSEAAASLTDGSRLYQGQVFAQTILPWQVECRTLFLDGIQMQLSSRHEALHVVYGGTTSDHADWLLLGFILTIA